MDKGGGDAKSDFINHIRDEICDHLLKHGHPELSDPDGPPSTPKLRDYLSASKDFPDAAAALVDGQFRKEGRGEDECSEPRTPAEDESLPAFKYLNDWLEGEGSPRIGASEAEPFWTEFLRKLMGPWDQLSENERSWIEFIRVISGGRDPRATPALGAAVGESYHQAEYVGENA